MFECDISPAGEEFQVGNPVKKIYLIARVKYSQSLFLVQVLHQLEVKSVLVFK